MATSVIMTAVFAKESIKKIFQFLHKKTINDIQEPGQPSRHNQQILGYSYDHQ
jgi:hypothetical protein